MCGGHYEKWKTPRQLLEYKGEPIVQRTIRLLREQGVEDIAISSDNPVFKDFGVPLLVHKNDYYARAYNDCDGEWCNCFYLTDEPTCYLMGDVVFSPYAIRKIVETGTNDILLFGSKPPYAKAYPKKYIEPFAFKVINTNHLKRAIATVKTLDRQGKFNRKPIAWELWSVIKGKDPNKMDWHYKAINDYTCDIDSVEEAQEILKW